MAKKTAYIGGCLCGAIRYEAVGEPERPHTCSCRMCQRHSGALTASWVEYPSAGVRWTGPGGRPAQWRSSARSSRAFCPQCGSSIGAIDDEPVTALLVGTFDRPNRKGFKPRYHSYRSSRPRWWCVEIAPD